MGLNSKNDEAERLIRELAMKQGESLTEVVTAAVRERLERLRRENQRASRIVAMLEIGRACAAALPPQPDQLESDPTGFLYDEVGLPK